VVGQTDRRAPTTTRRRRLAWLAAGVALLLSACHGGAGSPTELTSSSPSLPTTAGASGCGAAASPGSITTSLSVGGHDRLVIVHVPTGYPASSPTPLVLNMHGSGVTASDQEAFSGMDATADADRFIVAYPQGLIPDGSGYDWTCPASPWSGAGPSRADPPMT